MTQRARLVVDWGTSNFRCYRFAPDGTVAQTHQAAAGILSVTDRDFADVLQREIGSWISPDMDIFLSGMITSRNGWIETPYVEAPARLADLARAAVVVEADKGVRMYFLPGVAMHSPTPDVMRGEEIQVFGVVEEFETATVILPGTHSKWVEVRDGALQRFSSFMTGEVFGVLKTHSILGRLMSDASGESDEQAFIDGVRQVSRHETVGLLHDIFTTRSGVLLGQLPAQDSAGRLSGLLIGHEIRDGLAAYPVTGRLLIVGDAFLARRYQRALAEFGITAELGSPLASVDGFSRLSALGF
jgi:2-dehydro-3-deoxygalactonokinase